jgi:hypothetical protein
MLRMGTYSGLVSGWPDHLELTELGQEYLALNLERFYELTEGQKAFVVRHLILEGAWRGRTRDLLQLLTPCYSRGTFTLNLAETPLPPEAVAPVHLLAKLGLLAQQSGILSVEERYVEQVAGLLGEPRGPTEEQLADILTAKRELGALAEDAVVAYERRRLEAIGRLAESSLVRRISHLNVAAGFDVQSFDGDKPLYDYDRFIEVKASRRRELCFYWTRNERRVAGELGDKYWIYFVGEFRQNDCEDIAPVMIQDPATRLPLMAEIELEPCAYRVKREEPIELSAASQESLKGFAL